MHISLETPDQHSIQTYSDSQIQINSLLYTQSLIVSKQEVLTDITIRSIQGINETYMEQLLKHKPELIIIGHKEHCLPPIQRIAQLSQQGIGIEFMSIGAACRTYNILLSELRAVTLGLIL